MPTETFTLMDQAAAAKVLGLTNPRTLAAWRLRRQGPKYIKLGRTVRYSPADLQSFVAARTFAP